MQLYLVTTIQYPHPDEILLEEFLKPLGIAQYRLGKKIGVPQWRIGEIVGGRRVVTADTGLRLSRFFGLSDALRLGLQVDHNTAMTREAMAATLERIRPWPIRPNTRPAAAIVVSMSASASADDTKPASNAEGARYTPSASVRGKSV